MKKILFILLLFVNLQCVINQDGDIGIRSFTTAEAQHMNTEAFLPEQDIPGVAFGYKCSDCGREYLSYSDLQSHQAAKPYKCGNTYCYKRFCTKKARETHMNNSCFPCEYECPMVFSDSIDRKYHYKFDCPFAVRDSTRRKFCRYCALEFPTPEDRILHENVCTYKTKPISEQWHCPEENSFCIFEYLPQMVDYRSGISGQLETLACLAFEQPANNKSQQEIKAFKSKCNFDEFAREIRLNFRHSGSRIRLGHLSALVQYVSPDGSIDNYQMTYNGGAMICLDELGEVVDCVIGYERNNPHNYLTINGNYSTCIGTRYVVYVNPFLLMNEVNY